MRILVITPYLPHPHVGHGGGTAVRQLVRALARRHDVAVLSLLRPCDPGPEQANLGPGVLLETVPFRDAGARGLVERLGLAADRLAALWRAWRRQEPLFVAKYLRRDLLARAQDLVHRFEPDVVQVEYLQLAGVARSLRAPRVILDSHEHGALPRRRQARAARGWRRWALEREARAWDRLAARASKDVDAVLCVTAQDRQLLSEAGAVNLVTIPLGIDTETMAASGDRTPSRQALFVGSFAHPPNREAADLLCERIWPACRRVLPDWSLQLAGPGSDAFLAGRNGDRDGLTATGFVPDLSTLFAESAVFVAPLFTGGGIKIKILEAMARGIPLVTTPIGMEGIARRSDDLVSWAETPEQVVAAVVEVAKHPAAAAARAARARAHVEACFSWHSVVSRLEAVYRGESASLPD